jgi:glutamate/tyrosine decarboxylase-like PLP-dependent enzyme
LKETAQRLHDNFPYHHPLYAGQMLKPPHPVAKRAYALAMELNPNNHALDGGRASSRMEKEAVAELAAMMGWGEHLGHLTGGGTMANLEALWVAGRCHPGATVLASEDAHYTHGRISDVLGLPYDAVSADRYGRMDMAALEQRLEQDDVGTVVATLGATGNGAVDPLPEILALQGRYGFRLHVDAAYGGYFRLVEPLSAATRDAFDAISQADSIVIDPHKHGLQPYGCGCILFRDPAVGRFYKHDSPYTYFSSSDLHLGEISLECSRPGAAAVALWATQQHFPLNRDGDFAAGLASCHRAAQRLHEWLGASEDWQALMPAELDIVVWGAKARTASRASERAAAIFERAAERDLHLALIRLPQERVEPWWPGLEWDQDRVTCLRSCLMKWEHEAWLDEIYSRLSDAGAES